MFVKVKEMIAVMMVAILILAVGETAFAESEGKPNNCEVLSTQLAERAHLFELTLEKFSAESPKDVANIWAEGIKTRNGTMQYAVMCPKLKEQFKKEQDENGNPAWVTGVSSPWITEYEIKQIKNISPIQKDITIKFEWATSAGAEPDTESTISVIKNNGKWCIYIIEE